MVQSGEPILILPAQRETKGNRSDLAQTLAQRVRQGDIVTRDDDGSTATGAAGGIAASAR